MRGTEWGQVPVQEREFQRKVQECDTIVRRLNDDQLSVFCSCVCVCVCIERVAVIRVSEAQLTTAIPFTRHDRAVPVQDQGMI